MVVLACTARPVHAQHTEPMSDSVRDSVAMQTTFYFSKGQGRWTKSNAYPKMLELLNWAKADTTTLISIDGWADRSGTSKANTKISRFRAQTLRDYLVEQGVSPCRISYRGNGTDSLSVSPAKARRADAKGMIRLGGEPVQEQVAPTTESEQEVQSPVEQPRTKVVATPSPVTQPMNDAPGLRWYVGIEGGIPLGVSTLSSFAPEGDVGWLVGALGGYRFSPLLAAEVGISFGRLRLGADPCCEDYYLGVDGVRYLSPVTGMDTYSYKDIYSSVAMQQYALRLHVDLLQLVTPDWNKRWSLTLSPAIYGIGTKSTLKQSGGSHTIVARNHQFQFGAGAGIGAGYQLTENLGIGLRSGVVCVFGERYDGLRPTDHSENLIWNNTATLIWRFNCNKQ